MKTLTATAVLAVAAAGLAGCGNVSFGSDGETRSFTAPEGVRALKIRGEGGRVEVSASDTSAIKVAMRLRWSNDKNKPDVRRTTRGDTLTLSSKCAHAAFGPTACQVAYRVEVPRGMPVNIDNEDGSITATGLGGTVRLHSAHGSITADDLNTTSADLSTSDGDIRVSGRAATADLRSDHGSVVARGLTGKRLTTRLRDGDIRLSGRFEDADLRTSHGSVRAHGFAAERLTASSDDGDLRIDFASPPADVRVSSDHGSLRIALPPGESYAIGTATEHGEERIAPGVRRDSGSEHRISLTTGDGDIRVDPADQRSW